MVACSGKASYDALSSSSRHYPQRRKIVPENTSHRAANSRLGIRLFWFYSVFYFGFVLVNAFAASWVEWIVFPGINLAVLWGFALIGLAFLLAAIYGLSCKDDSSEGEARR